MHRLEAIARDMLGDAGAAQCPIERALDLAGLDRSSSLPYPPGAWTA